MRIERFEVIPDSFDYAPTGQRVAAMWSGDDTIKRGMVRAVKELWGMNLFSHEGRWGATAGDAGAAGLDEMSEIADLGNGLCFRRRPVN
ncbi:hypothetical protein [Actinoallomurus acaciae]|uniref:Uncharacterized protein n=1 Tax=Actinoallomurus acaciae TaxID=502577 RepID=A0ABV5YQE3_9ACTN